MSLRSKYLLIVALASIALATGSVPAQERATPGFRVVAEVPLGPPVQWAFDLRWTGDDKVAVAGGRDGIFEIAIGRGGTGPRPIPGSDRLEYAARLTASGNTLAAAAPFGLVEWRTGEGAPWRQDVPMSVIVDFDLSGDRLLLLGGRRIPVPGKREPQWAPEGGILFASRLGDRIDEPVLLLTAISGSDGKAIEMARCHVLDPGAVRFLSGGRYVVVPGVQPGILVYGPERRLLKAWSSTGLGIFDRCVLDEREAEELAADVPRRIRWWQRETVLDDVIPWGEWFAVVIRTPVGQGARWHLVPFGNDGPQRPLPLPVEASSPGIRLRADSRGERIALLLFDYEQRGAAPRHRPRVVVLERNTAP